MNKNHIGSSLCEFLKAEGIYDQATSAAVTRSLVWQIQEQMREQQLTKSAMAKRMGTSRSQLDRLLNQGGRGVTLETLHRAAQALNRELQIELV